MTAPTPLVVAVGIAITLAVTVVVAVEKWDHIAPVANRWGWLADCLSACLMVVFAILMWRRETPWGAVTFALIATIYALLTLRQTIRRFR